MMILAVMLAVIAGAALMVGYGALTLPCTNQTERRIGMVALSTGWLMLLLAAVLALARSPWG